MADPSVTWGDTATGRYRQPIFAVAALPDARSLCLLEDGLALLVPGEHEPVLAPLGPASGVVLRGPLIAMEGLAACSTDQGQVALFELPGGRLLGAIALPKVDEVRALAHGREALLVATRTAGVHHYARRDWQPLSAPWPRDVGTTPRPDEPLVSPSPDRGAASRDVASSADVRRAAFCVRCRTAMRESEPCDLCGGEYVVELPAGYDHVARALYERPPDDPRWYGPPPDHEELRGAIELAAGARLAAIELRDRRVLLRDGRSQGFSVALRDGRRIAVSPGRLRVFDRGGPEAGWFWSAQPVDATTAWLAALPSGSGGAFPHGPVWGLACTAGQASASRTGACGASRARQARRRHPRYPRGAPHGRRRLPRRGRGRVGGDRRRVAPPPAPAGPPTACERARQGVLRVAAGQARRQRTRPAAHSVSGSAPRLAARMGVRSRLRPGAGPGGRHVGR